uniref:uncharacterized protein LOC105353111 n=1 Tax=Fragaria vesca subsp. vesca TaxID=101020 RepID=UPI0005CB7DB6|nr:PREDICTED: uncharacterized protein LOC105353111 [Fragaria vesca subsp. vesca]
MPKVDIEAAPVCPSLCTDQPGDLKVLVESKSTSNMQKEGLDDQPGLVLPCPSFASYSCSGQVADTAVKVSGEFDNLTTLENKSDDHAHEDDDFTFDIPKWGQKFFFGPVFPVFNRDLLLEQLESSQRDLEAMEEKSKSIATGTALPTRKKLSDLFEQVDGRSFVMPTSTSSKSTKRSSAYGWKLRDVAWRTNSEGATMSSSRSSKKKPQRRSWVDRCIGHMLLCFSSS